MALHGSPRRTGSTGGVLDEYSRRLFVLRSIAARASAQACPSTSSNYSPEHAEHSQQCSSSSFSGVQDDPIIIKRFA